MTANSVVTRFSNQRVLYSRKVSTAQNPRFKALVHQTAFPCTNSTTQGGWYTRWPFPVPNPRFKAVGTPESLFLYQTHDSMQLVHQKAFSCTKPTIQGVGTPDGLPCTNSTIQGGWYTRRPFPVQNPRFKAIGTPDGLFLYKLHDSKRLVHQKAFSCTNSNHQIE